MSIMNKVHDIMSISDIVMRRDEKYMELLEQIEDYWTDRAEGYSQVNQEELAGDNRTNWRRELERHFPENRTNETYKILDIGTGPGFFSIILAEAGYQVTAVDYTEAMLEEAKKNAGAFAQKTWNLEDPEQAYKEWMRVLKKGGILLNYDANWYHHLFDAEKREEYEKDRQMVTEAGLEDHYTCTDIDTMEEIARQVPLSRIDRPRWDQKILQNGSLEPGMVRGGKGQLSFDTNVWYRSSQRVRIIQDGLNVK